MSLSVEKITIKESGSRIRLSADVLTPLGWQEFGQSFECWGVFRYPGELLCAPKALTTENGTHPFAAALTIIEELEPTGPVAPLAGIPSSRVLTAFRRIFAFDATWLNESRKQLDLKLGVAVTAQLGWSRGGESNVYGIPWTRVLILLAENRYQEVEKQDFTEGALHL